MGTLYPMNFLLYRVVLPLCGLFASALAVSVVLPGCTSSQAAQVETAISAGLVVAGDVCQLVTAIDPQAPPTSVTVACKVVGVAQLVNVQLPWGAWAAASQTTAAQVAPSDAGSDS